MNQCNQHSLAVRNKQWTLSELPMHLNYDMHSSTLPAGAYAAPGSVALIQRQMVELLVSG
jgi:hypothetical protein